MNEVIEIVDKGKRTEKIQSGKKNLFIRNGKGKTILSIKSSLIDKIGP